MAREITEVWIYVPPMAPHNVCVRAEPFAGLPESFQQHVTRVPLLTPHDAAVLEAAERYVLSNEEAWAKSSPDHLDRLRELVMASWPEGETLYDTLLEAVRARRAANAGGEG